MATEQDVKRIADELIQLHRDKEKSMQTTRRITVAIQEKRRELNKATRSAIDVSGLKQEVLVFESRRENGLFEKQPDL